MIIDLPLVEGGWTFGLPRPLSRQSSMRTGVMQAEPVPSPGSLQYWDKCG